MVSAVIFVLHGIAALILFVRRKNRSGLGEGLLAVGFFGILFSVGWTILTMVTSFLLPPQGLAEWLDRDAVTLSALTMIEAAAYVALRPKESGQEGPGGKSTST